MEKLQNQVSLFQVSEIEVIYRPKFKSSERPKICSSKDAYNIFYGTWDLNKIERQEQFKILLLNRACKVLGLYEVSSGGMAGTLADPKIIFSAALKGCACSIILVHNHPSGNLKPSDSDIRLTEKLKKGAQLLEIEIFDHIIITTEGYLSFADEGIM